MKGMFITFEGIEGCGKSSQADTLYQILKDNGYRCTLTREPGGTALGVELRKLVLFSEIYPIAELLLFLADRNQHVNEIIKPALLSGEIVICDRFYHSTYAYQSSGRKLDTQIVKRFNEFAIEDTRPDITFLLDIPPELGFSRKSGGGLELDRIESERLSFHSAIREGFLKLADEDDLIALIDGKNEKDAVTKDIFAAFKVRFPDISIE